MKTRLLLCIGMGLAVLPLSAAAAQPVAVAEWNPCPVLERLLAAGRETPAFGSLAVALARGEAIVLGFDAAHCRVEPGASLDCVAHDGVRVLSRLSAPPACAGFTTLHESRSRTSRRHVLGAPGGLRIEYGLSCIGCARPARSHFRIVVTGGGRAGQ